MFYPLTVRDFLERAATVYPDRVAVVDEPDQPAASWGSLTYAVSHNAARLLTSFFGARPKGVQLSHRNVWVNATTFRWHATDTDADVYLHALPMFHANGWGMPYAVTEMGGGHIVLRKIDGTEILRRIEEYGVTMLCAAPAVVTAALDGAQEWSGAIPGRDRVRLIVAGAPPPLVRSSGCVRSSAGSSSRSTV